MGTFDNKAKVHEFLGASGGGNFMNVSGDAAVNIGVEYAASFLDLLLNRLILSMYAPATARVKGTVVKYN